MVKTSLPTKKENQIAMQNASRVHVLETFQKLVEEGLDVRVRQRLSVDNGSEK